MTLVDEILMEDPDLETATFQLLDFSIPKEQQERQLSIRDGREIPRLSVTERDEMLGIWAEGFRLAQAEMAGMRDEPRDDQPEQRAADGQGDLFERGGS